jgi:predicted nucleotidyltransferase
VQCTIAKALAKRPEVQAGYVFGSVATGRTRPDSDVDVAVLLDDARIRSARRLRFRLALMTDLGAALHRPDVEVVILNDASPLLAHRVLSRGRLVFERSRRARVRFQVHTAARYLDLVPMYETFIRYTKKRARERLAHG